ncbi:hypothetical protein B0H14DRAFT_3727415 [Mycena olivaceomarginata]|nr:hypothetical protein B0H14DRAFT_3727415 [Mycena olivaceomarginata]
MFEAAETIPSGEIKAYRHFAFPPALGDPSHNPFFSVENASALITSHGYQLYLQHTDSESSLWDPDKATVNQIWGYRNYAWINLVAFQAYMNTVHGSFNEYRTQNSTPFSSCPPSRAESHVQLHPFRLIKWSLHIEIGAKAKRKQLPVLQVTRQEAVDKIIQISPIPSTWTVPCIPVAYLVNLSNAFDSLKVGNRTLTIDRFIRTEDQDSWGGLEWSFVSSGSFEVQGVYTCEFIDPSHFEGCECYEPDPAATQALWKAELDANEREAASAAGIVSRFYNQIMMSKCKVQCDGVPVFKRLSGGASYGKQFFIGCSKWTGAQKFEHRYLPIPNNVDEDTLRIAMENGGRLPTAPTVNEILHAYYGWSNKVQSTGSA